jgi:hypothetical protein
MVGTVLMLETLALIAVIGLLVGFALWAVGGETSGKARDSTQITPGSGDYDAAPRFQLPAALERTNAEW